MTGGGNPTRSGTGRLSRPFYLRLLTPIRNPRCTGQGLPPVANLILALDYPPEAGNDGWGKPNPIRHRPTKPAFLPPSPGMQQLLSAGSRVHRTWPSSESYMIHALESSTIFY